MATNLMILITVIVYLWMNIVLGITGSSPIGQDPSIVYAPYTTNGFLIYSGASGLESMYCEDEKCMKTINQTLIQNVNNIYSSSLLSINTGSSIQNCSNIINNKLYYCYYYIVVGYNKSSKNIVSFIICYDKFCNNYSENIIDSTNDMIHSFGYSISLSTYTAYNGNNNNKKQIYPMFTYSKYNEYLNEYILNVIICLDFLCNSYIGKDINNNNELPPYILLGNNITISKGKISIQEIWSNNQENYLAIMYGKMINNNNNYKKNNGIGLMVAGCSLNTENNNGITDCNKLMNKQLENNLISTNNEYLAIDHVSMVKYPLSETRSNVPMMIGIYTMINNKNVNEMELWILYCFNLFCNSQRKLNYKLWTSSKIDYPLIEIHYGYYYPSIIFFDDSSTLIMMSCEYQPVPWNCTQLTYNHPTYVIYENDNFNSSLMQISAVANIYSYQESLVLFSMVGDQGKSSTNYLGAQYILCETATCAINQQQHIIN